jgi:hypothetical protein
VQEKQIHHFLPKKYLRGFLPVGEQSRIWEYSRSGVKYNPGVVRGKYNPALISLEKKAGATVGEYALVRPDGTIDFNTYENQLEKLEKPSDAVFDAIRARKQISREQKEVLTAYIALMMRRVPARREAAKATFRDVVDEFENRELPEILAFIDALIESTDAGDAKRLNALQEQRAIALKRIEAMKRDGLPREMELDTIVKADMPRVRQAISSMQWQFFEAPLGCFFITSDKPVHTFAGGVGLRQPYSELVFPISSEVALVASPHGVREGYVAASSQQVKEIARRVIAQARERVYACRAQGWVLTVMAKSTHRFNLLYTYNGNLDDLPKRV